MNAIISTYGGESVDDVYRTVQHWQLHYKGTFICDTSAPHIRDVLVEMAERLNDVDLR